MMISCAECKINCYRNFHFITHRLKSFLKKSILFDQKFDKLDKLSNKLRELEFHVFIFEEENTQNTQLIEEIRKEIEKLELEIKWVLEALFFKGQCEEKFKDPCKYCVGYPSRGACVGCSCYDCIYYRE